MSVEVLIDELEEETREEVANLKVRIERRFGSDVIYPYDVRDETVVLPLGFAVKRGVAPAGSFAPLSRRLRARISLYDAQREITDEVIGLLNAHRVAVLACYVGAGKTIMAVYLAKRVKLRTLIIVNSNALLQQWTESVGDMYGDVGVQVLKSRSVLDTSCDFFVIHATNIAKVDFPRGFIGFVVVDELHLIMAEGLHKCMQCLFPRFLLGLSATPYRTDGCDALIDLYFGHERIVKKLWCPHVVFKVSTHLRPRIELNANGEINWGSIIAQISENAARNDLIVRIVRHYSERCFLLLCKLRSQVSRLYEALREAGESVDYFCGTKDSFDRSVRVLVGTIKKCGTGFNFPKLDALVLCADVESYFIQNIGRIMRKKSDVKPLVFDLVDKNVSLERHFATRCEVYDAAGGEILDFRRTHAHFFGAA